jgi:competence ComEA-like helix-hairpin-helix protein
MMIKRPSRNLESIGFLFICLILAALSAARFNPYPSDVEVEEPCREGIYVQIGGDIPLKGTCFFGHPVDLAKILPNSLITKHSNAVNLRYDWHVVVSHSLIEITKNHKDWSFSRKEIPAHQKLTLGIPISVNLETEEGLTALPGIGPQTAKKLIYERQKRGGFKSLDELKTLPGIGKGTFRKIQPFLTL